MLDSYEGKIKSPFMIYAAVESILVPEDNRKQNPDESYSNKYHKHVACSYGYKLVCVDDKFSRPFKSYLGKEAAFNFINSMVEESKYCSDVMKKNILENNLKLKKRTCNFQNFTKCWICDNVYVDGDVKVRDHSNITENIEAFHIEIVISGLQNFYRIAQPEKSYFTFSNARSRQI